MCWAKLEGPPPVAVMDWEASGYAAFVGPRWLGTQDLRARALRKLV